MLWLTNCGNNAILDYRNNYKRNRNRLAANLLVHLPRTRSTGHPLYEAQEKNSLMKTSSHKRLFLLSFARLIVTGKEGVYIFSWTMGIRG